MSNKYRKNKPSWRPQYVHHQAISIYEGLLAIDACLLDPIKKERVQVGNHMVHTTSLRLRTFLIKGITCYICGLKATQFSIDDSPRGTQPHMNLWGVDVEGKTLLFTHDHVVDRARGGADTLDNSETCCSVCNSKKNTQQIAELGWAKPEEKKPRTNAFSKERYTAEDVDCEIAFHRKKEAYVFSIPPKGILSENGVEYQIGHRVPKEWNVFKKRLDEVRRHHYTHFIG